MLLDESSAITISTFGGWPANALFSVQQFPHVKVTLLPNRTSSLPVRFPDNLLKLSSRVEAILVVKIDKLNGITHYKIIIVES